tara:strand:- start:397 stop:1467 length:1071 start_codon:yes stop_codon:yes gene_type:complete
MALSKIQDTGNQVIPNLGRRNLIINGAMMVNQRAASYTVSSTRVKVVDRFSAEKDTNDMTAVQSTDAPTGFEYSLKLTNGTGASSSGTNINYVKHFFEGYDTNHLEIGTANAKEVTLSFHVKSSITGTYCVTFADSGNDNPFVSTYTINSADTWEKKTVTITMSTYSSWVGHTGKDANLQIIWDLGSGPDRQVSTLNAWQDGVANKWSHSSQTQWVETTGATWYLTGVQLEVGDTATDFEHRSHAEEYHYCQRYFQKTYRYEDYLTNNTGNGCVGFYATSSADNQNVTWATPMRTTPDMTIYRKNGGAANQAQRGNNSGTYATLSNIVAVATGLEFTHDATNNAFYRFHYYADAEF